MKTRVEDGGPCRKIVHVDVPSADLAADYEVLLKRCALSARLPGFRRGKAPLPVVEKEYRKEIDEEAKEWFVPRFYRDALAQESIKAVSIVGVHDVSFAKAKGLTFRFTVDVAPEFKLPKYKKLTLKENHPECGEQEVVDAYARLLDSCARFEDVGGRGIQEGDLALLDYTAEFDGRSAAELAPECSGLAAGKDAWAMVGDPEFIPGFNAGLLGAGVGEDRQIQVRFPEDYHVSALAGHRAVYAVKVKGLREKRMPEIDEAFLKRFGVDSEVALREKVRSELKENAERREKDRLREEIAKFLLEKTDLDLPASLVERETHSMIRDLVQRRSMQGVPREQIEADRDEIVKVATESARHRVKLSFILTQIALDEKIEVQDDEVSARVDEMAKRYRIPPDQLRTQLEKRDGLAELKNEICAEKTMDFLLDNARIKR